MLQKMRNLNWSLWIGALIVFFGYVLALVFTVNMIFENSARSFSEDDDTYAGLIFGSASLIVSTTLLLSIMRNRPKRVCKSYSRAKINVRIVFSALILLAFTAYFGEGYEPFAAFVYPPIFLIMWGLAEVIIRILQWRRARTKIT